MNRRRHRLNVPLSEVWIGIYGCFGLKSGSVTATNPPYTSPQVSRTPVCVEYTRCRTLFSSKNLLEPSCLFLKFGLDYLVYCLSCLNVDWEHRTSLSRSPNSCCSLIVCRWTP